ncbi:Dabb family protein [Streptomyces sp. NBC_01754]|uniref:Dabb family protein n=1 Tax=Streptomyces sp. NBC_01754 TaxID=2975930 RepID=UPI002DD85FD8|nr:Dabb family protein [Streptomyces sp. NBC_01754]WSC91834.1 Dabb family protein [Streptomyces sp. NBC_01754]
MSDTTPPRLRHIGTLTLRPDTGADARTAIRDGLDALVGQVPGLLAMRVHEDAGLRDGTADLVFLADFGDEDAWRAYADHPAHLALAASVIRPVLAGAVFVQARL